MHSEDPITVVSQWNLTPKVLASVSLLLEVFNCIGPLIPFLQKGQDSLCISQAQTVVDLTLLNLKKALYKINLFCSKRVTKLICKLLSKFYCYPCRQEPFNFHHFKEILKRSLSLPMKKNLKHLNRCISWNVFQHLILKDCQKISAKLQDTGMDSLKS